MSDWYDKEGNPMELDDPRYRELMGDWDYKIVGKTELAHGTVSTVWLGLDHGWGDGPPVIFETLVFGGPYDQDMERYCTEAEAKAGHERWVRKVKFLDGTRFEDVPEREDA